MSKKFNWSTYEVPRRPPAAAPSDAGENANSVRPSRPPAPPPTFTLRHLKQGATGAVKTWFSAPVLLDYLLLRGGLRGIGEKSFPSTDGVLDPLDLTLPHSASSASSASSATSPPCRILELGGGTGFLSLGLALSLNAESTRVQLVCTDGDKATLKNMRHNVERQPAETRVTKTVRVAPLEWGGDLGGATFARSLRAQFGAGEGEDPVRRLSHLIAADVHYGETTMEPLSAVVAAVKLRNPEVAVVLMLKERGSKISTNIANLKVQIEAKVGSGLEFEDASTRSELEGFSVRLRDVLHEDLSKMKIIEC
uniref:Calmodulin-lysine N-methyltransferase n=1 Tax=Corethron hystrix TaxID=216773 RepID=A0A7S1B504_9STRA|mmetsp:Transcript_13116/g.28900  ORF Transcript_13116/g.28900 Transcript_13116/m.28900 type:complete len:309 (+) Transcript_13116:175-1101(+)